MQDKLFEFFIKKKGKGANCLCQGEPDDGNEREGNNRK